MAAKGPKGPNQDTAQAVALSALAFLAADPALLGRFLALSGCGPQDLKARLHDPAFLTGVLEFILGDEAALLAFAESAGLDPETPARAWQLLGGGGWS